MNLVASHNFLSKYTALVSLKVNVKNDFRAKNCRRLHYFGLKRLDGYAVLRLFLPAAQFLYKNIVNLTFFKLKKLILKIMPY